MQAELEANKEHIKKPLTETITKMSDKFTYGKAQIFRNACENITRLGGKLLRDFEQFARIIRLHYMHYIAKKEQHPFYVKSNWNPLEKLRMRKQNTKTTVPLDVAPERRTKRCSPRFRPGGRFL